MSQPELACAFCVSVDAVQLLWDKRGKPYVKCILCGVRAFMPTARSLRGLALVEPYVRHIAELAKRDASVAAQDDALVDRWRSSLQERRQQIAQTAPQASASDGLVRRVV